MGEVRIGIIGLGAVGGAVAARLLASRLEGERFGLAAGSAGSAERIRAQGFVVQSGRGEERARLRVTRTGPRGATDEAQAAPRGPEERRDGLHDRLEAEQDLIDAALPAFPDGGLYSLILLCTRAEGTDAALAQALPLLDPTGAIACLQNGLPEARVAARAGAARTLGAVIGWSATSTSPGAIAITGQGGFLLGAAGDTGASSGAGVRAAHPHERLQAAARLLSRAFPTRMTDNLAGARWSKLALNCAISSLGAVSGLSFGELARSRDGRALALAIIAEVASVAAAKGVRLSRISGLDPRWLADAGDARLSSRLARPLRDALFWLASRQRPRQRSGMLERLLAGRTSGQIEDLNGAVLVEARALGVAVPLNERVVGLVHAIERGEARIGVANLRELRGSG